jgi:signal transduction histidine kinase
MSFPQLDPATTVFVIGVLYTLMPLTVWTVLRGRRDDTVTALWCVGSLLSGVNYVLFGLREQLPLWLALQGANFLGYLGYGLRIAALRRERGLSAGVPALSLVVALACVAYGLASLVDARVRVATTSFIISAASVAVAWQAWQLHRVSRSRSALMVTLSYVALAAAALLRMSVVLAGPSDPIPFDFTGDVYLLLFTALLTSLWGNIGYLGFAIEQAERDVAARTADVAAADARREQAERQAEELKRLSDERQELLRVISHEVRQPLHNAQAVLQGVEDALRSDAADGDAPRRRVDRARGVLRQITGGLDNILAASTLLVGQRPTPLRDTDLEMLLELCLGDLPPAGRERVRVARASDVRTAALDVGLMRLALRNLLNNALLYSAPGSTVTLRVTDSDDPLAIVFEVSDAGPGIAPELLPRVFERGVRGRHDVPGQGLGLYIVRVAMRLQGGSVDVRSDARGTTFTLAVPQGQEPG